MLHLGSYDSEPESFKLMESYALQKGFRSRSKNIVKFILAMQEKFPQIN